MPSRKLHIALKCHNERHIEAYRILENLPRGVKVHMVVEAVLQYAAEHGGIEYPTRSGKVFYPIRKPDIPPGAALERRVEAYIAPTVAEERKATGMIDQALDFFDMK